MPNDDDTVTGEQRAATRDRVLRAAIELIAEVGGDRLRTRAVAERAGVNQALVHYHFGSMTALLREAEEAVLASEGAPFFEVLEGPVTPRRLVNGLFETVQRIGEPTPELMVAIDMLNRATRDPASRARAQEMLAGFRQLLREQLAAAQQRGEINDRVDPEAVTLVITALFDGLGMHRLLDPELDIRPALKLVTALLTPGGDDANNS